MGRKRRSLLRRPFETAAVRFALRTVPLLPHPALLALARAAGRLGYCFDRRGRRIGLANLDIAFGSSKTAAEKRHILRGSFITMAQTFLDIIWFGGRPQKRLMRYVELDESMRPRLCEKNQIIVTAHFGNWEAAGQIVALGGCPLYSIAMPVKNPDVNRLLIRQREATGQKIIPRTGALRKLLDALRNNGKTALLVDQNTPEKEGGVRADFFGLPVPVSAAPAVLAARTGSEILVAFCRPQCGGRYRIYITDSFAPPFETGKDAAQRLTQRILSAIEREIRAHPEHWLWMYKRWKKIYRPADAERYPFYARRPS